MEAAKYCRQLIARTHQNGLRENIPSKFEVHKSATFIAVLTVYMHNYIVIYSYVWSYEQLHNSSTTQHYCSIHKPTRK